MTLVQKIEHWGDEHHPRWLDGIRIALGFILAAKGMMIIGNTAQVQFLLYSNHLFGFSELLVSMAIHIVVFIHLTGGTLIALGLLTRFAAVIQMPILLCAIVFVNIGQGFSVLNTELWLSVLVFCLLILFWIVGSGPLSVDTAIRKARSR